MVEEEKDGWNRKEVKGISHLWHEHEDQVGRGGGKSPLREGVIGGGKKRGEGSHKESGLDKCFRSRNQKNSGA